MLKISHFLWNREYQTQFYASNTDDIKSFTQDIYASAANATDILFILIITMGKYTDIWSFCSTLYVSCNIAVTSDNNTYLHTKDVRMQVKDITEMCISFIHPK